MSAAIGSAEQAITSGVVKLPDGMKPEDASGMIALSYGITYIWGTVGIILICKYLPRWWGVDAKAAAKQYEQEFGVKDLEGGGLTGYRQFGLRAYRLENPAQVGMSIAKFRTINPGIPHRQRGARRRAAWEPIPTSCCKRATSSRLAARPSI